MKSSTVEVYTMISSILLLLVMQSEQSVQMCASLIDESKVEETTVRTSTVDDSIHRIFRRAISRLLFFTTLSSVTMKLQFCTQRNWHIWNTLSYDSDAQNLQNFIEGKALNN